MNGNKSHSLTSQLPAGGSGDGTVGGAVGDDIRGVQLAVSANILWAYATVGRKLGKRVMGNLEGWAETISGEFNSQAHSMFAMSCELNSSPNKSDIFLT